MKSYVIRDEYLQNRAVGYLFYYEKAKAFIIELCRDLDEWEAPLLFQGMVKKGIYTIPKDFAFLWVQERVIPSGRQNIGMILRNAKLTEYDEMALLALSRGRCSQDECYIEEIAYQDIPEDIRARTFQNVAECFPSEDKQLICSFRDNTVRKVDLEKLADCNRDISYIVKNDALLQSVKVGVGGYSIVFNDSIEIEVTLLRERGTLLPLYATDLLNFARRNIVDTTRACDMMQCSRQNLSYLVKTEQITPIICGTKENLYTKGTIEQIKNA